jgi:hypothetical protein
MAGYLGTGLRHWPCIINPPPPFLLQICTNPRTQFSASKVGKAEMSHPCGTEQIFLVELGHTGSASQPEFGKYCPDHKFINTVQH